MPRPRPSLFALALALALVVELGAPVAAKPMLVDIGGVSLTPRPVLGYRRGRPKRIMVVPLDEGEVEVKTAQAYAAMRAAATAAGVEFWIVSGFRSQERQQLLYAAWRAGFGNRAARPGRSNHQSGRALDLEVDQPGTLAWLDAHARKFGFKRTVKDEPWHWEHDGKRRNYDKVRRRILRGR